VAEAVRPADVVRRSAEYLARHGVDEPRGTAETLLMNLLGTNRAGLYARSEALDARTARLYGRALCRRCSGVPLQYITRRQQFLDLTLEVRPGVFVPRPETEGLALASLEALAGIPGPVVVDVGTGTGAIALVVKSRRPDARVLAVDLSPGAVALARSNAERLRIDVEVRFGDLLEPVPAVLRGTLDLIVSNPPYVTEEEYEGLPDEVKAEPFEALVGGTDIHRRLVDEASVWLRPGGWLLTEIGAEQGREVMAIFQARLVDTGVITDLAGRDRVVRGRRPGP
jgi:release factor glutamine methyltransferase